MEKSSLNMRLSQSADPRLYNPNRDLAWNFKAILSAVITRLDCGLWAELHELLEAHNVDETALAEAMNCFITFIANCTEHHKESLEENLRRSGFLDCPSIVQIGLMAYVGSIVTGMAWGGIREVTLGGKGPTSDMEELVAAGQRLTSAITNVPGPPVPHKLLDAIACQIESSALSGPGVIFWDASETAIRFYDQREQQYYQITVSAIDKPSRV